MATKNPTRSADRLVTATAATVVLALSAIVDFANIGGYLSGAPIPPGVVGIEAALGVAALAAAGGLWAGRRWALLLALAVAVITVLISTMGFLSAGSVTGNVVAAAGAILGLGVLALVAPVAVRRAAA